ncbi:MULTISPECIES: glycoside hydrolase family 16 protein [Nocardioides]|uniref:glycoside hydrolase family 16 protein n=1 Tax=Nocardioides TaxID=1839 RepID=UPI002868248C|nr:glycoside hydrolase family 16 protein [Nocardioides sp. CGMCC 1.13656]
MPFVEDFAGSDLDRTTWLPSYLPVWSSTAASAATYAVSNGRLVLRIPPEQGLWCAGDHEPPLRVSGIQSGAYSGPVGSTRGQQRFREGQVVREAQPRFEGWLPAGRVEVRCAMTVSPRSMAALWLSGFEDDPAQEQCGELCVVEVFGKDVDPGRSAEVGVGIKPFRDPALHQDFAAPRLPIDVAAFHTYAVEWDASAAVFTVDGEEVRRCARPPTYPMQVMVGVFDFPGWSAGDDDHLVPELEVDWIRGR